MFRVVSENLPAGASPFYLLLCDDPRCATAFHFPIPEEMSVAPESKAIKSAQEDGWRLSIGRQLCPFHRAQLSSIEDAGLGKPKLIQASPNALRNGKLVTQ